MRDAEQGGVAKRVYKRLPSDIDHAPPHLLTFCDKMKRLRMVRAGLFVGLIFLLWGSLQVGVNLGTKAGRTDYHNEYMRNIQMELGNLNEAIDRGDMGEVQIISSRASALALAAGNSKKFHEVLGSHNNQTEQGPGQQLPADPIHITIDLRHKGIGDSNIVPFWNLILASITEDTPRINVNFQTTKTSFRMEFTSDAAIMNACIDYMQVTVTAKQYIIDNQEISADSVREKLALYKSSADLTGSAPILSITPSDKITMTRLVEYFQISASEGITRYIVK